MLHPARSPIIKPPRGTPINRAHPLSRGLVCAIPMSENAGNSVWDYVGNCGRGSLDGSAVWDSRGVYTSETDDTGHIDVALPSWLRSRLQDAVSITCTYTRVGAVLYSHLFAAGSGNLEWACYLGSDGKIRVSIDGSEHAATATGVADGETAFVGWGFDRTAGIAHAQRDAEVIRNTGLTINQPTVDSGLVLLNRSFNSQTRDADGIMHWFLMWDRLLSVEEFATVWREPFAVYNRSARSRYFNVAGGTTLVVSEAQSATVIESPALTQKHNLAVDDIASAGSLDQPSLTQVHQLLVDDLTSATSTESVSLSLAILLTVVDALSSAAVDNIALTQKHILSVDDLASGGILDAVDLNQKHLLAVADLLSASNIDNISFNLPSGIVTISISASGPGITIQAKKPSVIAQ